MNMDMHVEHDELVCLIDEYDCMFDKLDDKYEWLIAKMIMPSDDVFFCFYRYVMLI